MCPIPVHVVYPSGQGMRPALRAFIDFLAEDLSASLKGRG